MRKKAHPPVLILLIILVVIAVIGLAITKRTPEKNEQIIPESSTQTPAPTLAPSPLSNTYKNNIFSFVYNPEYKMQESTASSISWTDPSGSFSMELVWQNSPFPKVPADSGAQEVKIDREKESTISKNKVRELVYACGENCYYHALQIQSGDQYYQLKAPIGGGELEGEFQHIITSIKFIE